LKVVFGLLFATDISLIAYLFNEIELLSSLKSVLVLVGLLLVTIAIKIVNRKAMDKINELGEI